VVDLLGLTDTPWVLAMDRTNWDFGKTTINILMISVMWNGMGIPLIWVLLPKAGNSNTRTRICLLNRLHKVFPKLGIASLMGDREFIGDEWMAYLQHRKIPYIMRLRANQHVVRYGHKTRSIADIVQHLHRRQRMIIKGRCQLGQSADEESAAVRLVIMRLPTGELLALACSGNPRRALRDYRRRWTIETLFGNLKTKGFNMEDTHITDRTKLSTLLAVLALAVALSVKTGVAIARIRKIPTKKHGRRAWSLFALGLNGLRKIFAAAAHAMKHLGIITFLTQLFSPRLPSKPLLYMAL
jgi:hypothetical protein